MRIAGAVPIIELGERSSTQEVRLILNTRSLGLRENLLRRNEPFVSAWSYVHTQVAAGDPELEIAQRAKAGREVRRVVLQAVIATAVFRGVRPGAVVVDLGVVAIHGNEIQERVVIREAGEGQLDVGPLVKPRRELCRCAELYAAFGKVRAEVLGTGGEAGTRIKAAETRPQAMHSAEHFLQNVFLNRRTGLLGLGRQVGREIRAFSRRNRSISSARVCADTTGGDARSAEASLSLAAGVDSCGAGPSCASPGKRRGPVLLRSM